MATIEVNYFNSFNLNRLVDSEGNVTPPKWLGGNPAPLNQDPKPNHWYLEESRIRGGFNNVETGYGVKAHIVEDNTSSQNLSNGIIYSGIFNSRTGFNETNRFSVGEDITKSVDPAKGSIQKLYAEDTNLIIFQESKVSRALIDKDAIYSAEGGGTITSSREVIGQVVSYAGEYGISTDPNSFAVYGYRKYFTDKRRNAVLRLSVDGITEISNYGMKDFFRDEFGALPNTYSIVGTFDTHNKVYVLSLQKTKSFATAGKSQFDTDTYKTLYFDDAVNGWVSFLSFKPTLIGSLRSDLYSFYKGKIYRHYSDIANSRNTFYNQNTASSIEFIFNPDVSMSKVFQTINYEGSNGWEVIKLESDYTGEDSIDSTYKNYYDKAKKIYSYNEGLYSSLGVQYRAGFNRKENKYTANIINDSEVRPGEVIFTESGFGSSISGIKGYFATAKIQTDSTTNLGGAKELFAVSTNYIESSY
jgi:hypothetical protein